MTAVARSSLPDRSSGAWVVAAAAATVAVVASAIGALLDGVQLLGEPLLFETRARDVFTSDHPLLGLRSSASSATESLNHPGPLLFELFAVPVRVLGGPVGVTVAMAALVIASIWIIALSSRAVGGAGGALVAMVAT
ncbi:MAG: hypothetical protein ACRDZ2_06420, partial [Ilumatobacteraceae bacterium]